MATGRLGIWRSARRRIAVAAALGLFISAAAAQAQVDPYATTERQATQNGLDTDLTPVAKETDLWTLVHGAEFGETNVIDGSITSFDTDLFALSVRNLTIGLAGGSACAATPVQERGESDAEFGERVDACRGVDGSDVPRVPALYRYISRNNGSEAGWERLKLPGDDSHGYIGGIAWIDTDRALIVGGTGIYPRRELGPTDKDQYGRENAIEDSTDPDKADVAGKGRAWIYTQSTDSVQELDLSALTDDEADRAGMRGLSAVDCASPALCFAGGLAQIWEFKNGAFTNRRIDAKTPESQFANAFLLRYRVRDIDGGTGVTAGCCSTDPLENTPRIVSCNANSCSATRFGERTGELPRVPPVSSLSPVSPLAPLPRISPQQVPACVHNELPALWERLLNPDCAHRFTSPIPPPVGGLPLIDQPTADLLNEQIAPANIAVDEANHQIETVNGGISTANEGIADANQGVATANGEIDSADDQHREWNDHPEWPDSIYSLFGAVAILSPGGPEQAGERPAAISGGAGELAALRAGLSTARLVDGDGDIARTDPSRLSAAGLAGVDVNPIGATYNRDSGDGIPDWVVGELRSSERPALGAQGLLLATTLPPRAQSAVNASVNTFVGTPQLGINNSVSDPFGVNRPTVEEILKGEYEPINQDRLEDHIDSTHYSLPSYTANAIDIVGHQEDGWAVGDHGAILRLSVNAANAAAAAASEPEPPQLGEGRRRPLSNRDAYGQASPALPTGAGEVPALGGETLVESELRMTPSGATGIAASTGLGIRNVIMSRDGSEGWAIGGASDRTTLAHFDGVRWAPCDPVGIPGLLEPDPVCEEMAALRNVLTADTAVRVPLENDGDPANDDELEIVALGYRQTKDGVRQTVVRYRDDRWRLEDDGPLATLLSVAQPDKILMVSPDEAWALDYNIAAVRVLHFDGERWTPCDTEPAVCGDAGRRLPTDGREIAGMALAGERVYVYGGRIPGGSDSPLSKTSGNLAPLVPLILYRDPGGQWTDGSAPGEDGGGFDPGFSDAETAEIGPVRSLSVAERPGAGFEGWAVGKFGGIQAGGRGFPETALMRLDPSEAGWQRYHSPGAFDDYMIPTLSAGSAVTISDQQRLQVTYPSAQSADGAFIGEPTTSHYGGRIFGFDSARGRFAMLDTGRYQGKARPQQLGQTHPKGILEAMAPDGQGGFWAAVSGYMFHYTDRTPKPIFEDAPNPLGIDNAKLRAIAGGPDGSVWVASASDRLFRYERTLGWERARIPGWEPGGVVTRASAANAIAIGPGGEGLVVGDGGRIADLSPEGVSLDPAAGRSCALGDPVPCGTSRDLGAVDIAPDGSALALGDRLTVLWRGPQGGFRAIAKPAIASSIKLEAVSFPTPTRAYLATDSGVLFRGEMSAPGDWRWRAEGTTPTGESLAVDEQGRALAIYDVAVDAEGHGYAVGEQGLVLERSESGGWRRLPNPVTSRLSSVALSPGGDGVLIGGARGLILTGAGTDLAPARVEDFALSGAVVGFAYLPGSSEGSVDAWAAIGAGSQGRGDDRLLRYRFDPSDPTLEPADGALARADAPPHREGELAIAAFGKADCDFAENVLCPEMSATTTTNEAILERIVDELVELRERGEIDLAVLSGDATDSAGHPASSLADLDRVGSAGFGPNETQEAGQLKHRRFSELVANELADKGVSLFGAIGGQDLTETFFCDPYESHCETAKPLANAGENFGWREAFGDRAEPWGDGSNPVDSQAEGAIAFEPASGSADNAVRVEGQSLDADGEGVAPAAKAEIGGAATHYAIDAVKDGEPAARIVFVDTSLRSLAASDPLQQPQEIGGQMRFLERMICEQGQLSSTGDPCTREPGQAAIVVSNTPTYSYGPGALTHTATDGTSFEALMLRYDVDLVISGALGYNGLYYTLAPGIHEPCPGGDHPTVPPEALPSCAGAAGSELSTLEEHGAPNPADLLAEQGLAGAVPTLIAAGAGGKFGPDGRESADGAAGQWHGYSLARLMPDGELVVEQRPILDWIGMDADEHTLEARSKLELRGYGRSPISTTTEPGGVRGFHYEISTAAITHRYDLLLADPREPWLACEASDAACVGLYERLTTPMSSRAEASRSDASHLSSRAEASRSDAVAEGSQGASATASAPGGPDACDPYLCLPANVGTVDRLSGEVQAGNGKYPDTFAVAMLSVDEKVATWPLVFKRSPSFIVSPAVGFPAIPSVPAGTGAAPSPPAPPNPPAPQIPQVNTPAPPLPPPVAPLQAAQPPEPQPPAPPAPPPPTEQPSPLSLTLAPPGIAIATPTAVIQPPTPPVNPAPPGGARREARQRQAAAQKSGADSDQESQANDSVGDLAGSTPSAHGAEMTRYDGSRQDHGFTRYEPLARATDSSPLEQGLLYAGGITMLAAALALGWQGVRPTPRRTPPEVPVPALARARRRT